MASSVGSTSSMMFLALVTLAVTFFAVAHAQTGAPRASAWAAGSGNCTCSRELAQLRGQIAAEAKKRHELKSAMETHVAELHELRTLVRELKNASAPPATKYSGDATPSVSFSAKLSYNRELKPLDTVVFDTVVTNNGQSYDASTGKFEAPVSGTYVFYATILSGYNTKVETAIIVNDKEVARMYSGAHDAHGSGSNAAIVDMRTGDLAWVRLLYQGGSHVHGYYSTFSGALLSEAGDE